MMKTVERKAYLANPKHQYHASQCGELDCHANNKKNGDYHVHQRCPISRMNFDYTEYGGKKTFLANQKHQYDAS